MPTVDNMKIWNEVCVTDPDHTKHVNARGGFTAIDAMYQVRRATEIFGPVGQGWGWDFDLEYPGNGTVIAVVTLWHGDRTQTVKQVGQKSLGAQKPDEDAVKKAVTDGLTKCLSYLGFNADVFLGLFDDNKYVQAAANATAKAKIPAAIIKLNDLCAQDITAEKLEKEFSVIRDELKRLQEDPVFSAQVNGSVANYQATVKKLKQKEAA